MSEKIKVAIIGSGNIGTDLMIKVMRLSNVLEMAAFVGIDPESDGLKRAERLGVPVTADGIDGLVALPNLPRLVRTRSTTTFYRRMASASSISPLLPSDPIQFPRSMAKRTSMRPMSTWSRVVAKQQFRW
jgi:acetaldehyde dehydrogenase (acetylating)